LRPQGWRAFRDWAACAGSPVAVWPFSIICSFFARECAASAPRVPGLGLADRIFLISGYVVANVCLQGSRDQPHIRAINTALSF